LKFFIGADGNSFSESGIRTYGGIVIFIAQFCIFFADWIKPLTHPALIRVFQEKFYLMDSLF
jgi:hypothetical protein